MSYGCKAENGRENIFYESAMRSHPIKSKEPHIDKKVPIRSGRKRDEFYYSSEYKNKLTW